MGGEDVERRSRTGWREFAGTFGWPAGARCGRGWVVNAWNGCAVKVKPTSITATSSALWCASRVPSPVTASGSNCFPPCTSAHFRLAYDALREWRRERADVEYVRILRLAATTMEATVDRALSLLLEAGQTLDYTEVRDLAEPKAHEAPLLTVRMAPDLKVNDRLLTGTHGQSRSGRGVRMTVVDTRSCRTASASCAVNLPTVGTQVGGSFPRRWPRRRPAHGAEGAGTGGWDRRHRHINRLRRETRLPSGKTWETPVFAGAGSSSMTGCPWRSGSNRTDSAGRTCARCSGGCSSGAASWPTGWSTPRPKQSCRIPVECRKWRRRRVTPSADFSVTFLNEATGPGKNA